MVGVVGVVGDTAVLRVRRTGSIAVAPDVMFPFDVSYSFEQSPKS